MLVHAKDDAARQFYLHCAAFIAFPAGSRTLFLPIATVVAALGEERRRGPIISPGAP